MARLNSIDPTRPSGKISRITMQTTEGGALLVPKAVSYRGAKPNKSTC